MAYKIRDHLEPAYRQNPRPGGGFYPEPELEYTTIDLMIRLLDGISYTKVYGRLDQFLPLLRQNVVALDASAPERQPLLDFIDALLPQLAAHRRKLKLRRLFEEVIPPGDEFCFVVEAFRALRRNPAVTAVCMPFLHIQDQDPGSPIVETPAMDEHIQKLGRFKLLQLYDKDNFTAEEKRLIAKARAKGIFTGKRTRRTLAEGRRKQEPNAALDNTLWSIGLTNYRTCNTNSHSCETTPTGFCSTDASGNCSAMSSP